MHVLREAALWVGAAIGTLCLGVAAAAVALGATPLVFRSGSMSPGIPTGSLAVAISTPAERLEVGDIVSVLWDHTRVTHRLIGTGAIGDGTYRLQTQGDANPMADARTVVVDRADRVVWSAPGLGFLVEAAGKPQTVFVVGVLVGALLILAFRRPGARPEPRVARETVADAAPRHAAGRSHHGRRAGVTGVAAVAGLAVAASLIANAPAGTLAAFSDPALARPAFATGQLDAPVITGCELVSTGFLQSGIKLTWTAPAGLPSGPYTYQIDYTKSALLGGTSGSVTNISSLNGTVPIGTLAIGTVSMSVTAKAGNWISPTPATRTATLTTVLLTSCV
ncbi:hypothetical protein BH10ACT7_BH10ACT7_20570 [soil metagenome]